MPPKFELEKTLGVKARPVEDIEAEQAEIKRLAEVADRTLDQQVNNWYQTINNTNTVGTFLPNIGTIAILPLISTITLKALQPITYSNGNTQTAYLECVYYS